MDAVCRHDPLEIPYRLESAQDVLAAEAIKFRNIEGKDFNLMHAVAKNVVLLKPMALQKARREVIKDFFILGEKRQDWAETSSMKILELKEIIDFTLIEKALPWCRNITETPDLLHALREFSEDIQRLFDAQKNPDQGTKMLESMLELFRVHRLEMFSYVNSKKPNKLSMEQLKKLTAVRALFEPANKDILEALRTGKCLENEGICQNACAELLFERIPKFMDKISKIDIKFIRRKVLSNIAKLKPSPHQKIALFSYLKADITEAKLTGTLDTMISVGEKILEPDKYAKFNNFLDSLKRKIEFERHLYRKLFLTPELRQMRYVYLREKNLARVNKCTYREIVTLGFYPVKDYLDMAKYLTSNDCTGSGIAEAHLATPEYFSVRIFHKDNWIGNMYMLDFTDKHGTILVDRIQISKDIKVLFLNFFLHLREVCEEMFIDVDYKKILLPNAVSNHALVQTAFNSYKKSLKMVPFVPEFTQKMSFDSFKKCESYWVLSQKK